MDICFTFGIMAKMINKAIYVNLGCSIFLIAIRLHGLFSEEACHRLIVKKYYLWIVNPFILIYLVLSLLYVFGYLTFSTSRKQIIKKVIFLLPSIIVILGVIFGW